MWTTSISSGAATGFMPAALATVVLATVPASVGATSCHDSSRRAPPQCLDAGDSAYTGQTRLGQLSVAAALAGGAGRDFSRALATVSAAKLYKYRDPVTGEWVYTDRQPDAEQAYEEETLEASFVTPKVELLQERSESGFALIARSTYAAPVQLAFRITERINVDSALPSQGAIVIPARGATELGRAELVSRSRPASVEYQYQYVIGDPRARHAPASPYRLPYALASQFLVSQAPPDSQTHNDPSSRFAIDFAMPIGTPIYAARGGTVVEVASQYYAAGTNLERDGPRANIVRILHDDGTLAIYAHLNWNSIRVVPGQTVERGEYLADSGNTGFSTGPHLHFVVQRNNAGRATSVPVRFSGADGRGVTLRTGDRPRAYP